MINWPIVRKHSRLDTRDRKLQPILTAALHNKDNNIAAHNKTTNCTAHLKLQISDCTLDLCWSRQARQRNIRKGLPWPN